MIRLGLCCIFKEEPIKFRVSTAKRMLTFPREVQLSLLSDLCLHNARSLLAALKYCAGNSIADFRVQSQINPLRTHPGVGYALEDLPEYEEIIRVYEECRQFNKEHNLRTTFHPDQFIVLSTPHEHVLQSALAELTYQAEIAQFIGADVINIHGGGVYGDKDAALKRLRERLDKLPDKIRVRITLENDDRSFTPQDLHPLCRETGIPLVYDVHHHRCLPDALSLEKATEAALETWNREPLFHISSPREGWNSSRPQFHHDFIDIEDFPEIWSDLDITLEVEAKCKEIAIKRFRKELRERGVNIMEPGVNH